VILRKMKTQFRELEPVLYYLDAEDQVEALNTRLGQTLSIKASGSIFCIACGRKTSKSFQQGYCFPCTRSLARCDTCIIKPEYCHHHKGSCREPKWAEEQCMIPHLIYLANSFGVKVGVTRAYQRLTRWIDQGAVTAIPLAIVAKRLDAGLIEVALKEHFPDKTNWRGMLKGDIPDADLFAIREEATGLLPLHPFAEVQTDKPVSILYPVLQYPEKVQSLNLEKSPHIEGTLLGIKGQYLIFDHGVINLRSYAGYEVEIQG
jgi:hypothetical protein